MTASLVYLLLRQILQMLTQLARDGGAKDVELLVLRPTGRVAEVGGSSMIHDQSLRSSCACRGQHDNRSVRVSLSGRCGYWLVQKGWLV